MPWNYRRSLSQTIPHYPQKMPWNCRRSFAVR